jgi:molybdopterin-guanine dinucleotide biosynthesis protein A
MVSPSVLLAVLAGGRGERIGGAKANAHLAGRPLISYPLQAGREAGLETFVVAKRDTSLPSLEQQIVSEPDEPAHPLRGMLSGLDFATARSPAPAVLFVGCDMPFLTADLLRSLAALDGAVLAEVGGRLQPLPARCEPRHRAELSRALDARLSLRAALGALAPRVLAAAELSRFGVPERLFASVNTRSELAAAERALTGS